MDDPAGVQRRKRRAFWLAYAGWFVLNAIAIALVYIAANAAGRDSSGGIAAIGLGVIFVANTAALIALAFTRPMNALGAVTAMGTLFALAVVEGVFFTASDFVTGIVANLNPGSATANGQFFEIAAIGLLTAGFIAFVVGAVLVLRAIHRSIK